MTTGDTATDAGESTGPVVRIQAHLRSLPEGIGCRHLARERDGVDASLLVRLGLAKPILRSVPRCADHGCPWQPRCEHWPTFEPGAAGPVAGIKYKPTARGLSAAERASDVLAAVAELPLAAEVTSLLGAGPASMFALHSVFLRRARLAVREEGEGDLAGVDRVVLGGVLDLLVEVGRVTVAEDGVTFRRAGVEDSGDDDGGTQ